jgi:hypothetical protein
LSGDRGVLTSTIKRLYIAKALTLHTEAVCLVACCQEDSQKSYRVGNALHTAGKAEKEEALREGGWRVDKAIAALASAISRMDTALE